MKNQSAGKLINELSRAGQVFLQNEFSQYNIGYAQVRTLMFLIHNPDRTQNELVEYGKLDKSSITSQLKILEKNGYVTKQRSESDARKQIVNVTEKTRELLPELKRVFDSWTTCLLSDFTENEREDIFNYLQRMKKNVEGKFFHKSVK